MSGLWKSLSWLTCLALAHAAGAAGEVRGDVVLDGKANPVFKDAVPGTDQFDIQAEFGHRAGQNLFHSFERFSLRSGETVVFHGPPATRNVISRVTGGERSKINGTIRSEIAGADFYFINPAGVLFGPRAFLDVTGSFHASTANELRFRGGEVFSASKPNTSSFSFASPEAFGFLGTDPAPVRVNRSALSVLPREALSLVGGEVKVTGGQLIAPAGALSLVGLNEPGAVRVSSGAVRTGRGGEIALREGSILRTAGDGGGAIRIRGGAIVIQDQTIVSANNAGATGSQGGIDVEADRLEMRGRSELTADAAGQGHSGTVTVAAGELEIRDGSFVRSSSFGHGAAGSVNVDVGQLRIFRDGSDRETGIMSDARAGIGDAGTVTVRAADIQLRDGGEIRSSTFSAGDAGRVVVDAGQLLISGQGLDRLDPLTGISSQVLEGVTGNGGDVLVTADHLELRADGKVRSVTFSEGHAGRVEITVHEVALESGGQISSSTFSTGDSGKVMLTVHESLSISGHSRFQDDRGILPPSGVFASANSFRPDAGAGGTVTVTAPAIRLADRGEIASEVFGGGAGGALEVEFVDLLQVDDAEITTKARTSDAGDLRIAGGTLIDLRNGSEISTTIEEDSTGNAGDINVKTDLLVVDSARIQANGFEGQGGNIQITVDQLIRSPDGIIQAIARSDLGIDGTVVISTPEADLSGGLVVLEGALLDASSQLRERCAARRDVGASSFTGVGRGGLPPGPDAPLASAYLGGDAAGGATRAEAAVPPSGGARGPVQASALAAAAPCVAWLGGARDSP
jgi:filamentous hemagglutinin family protein